MKYLTIILLIIIPLMFGRVNIVYELPLNPIHGIAYVIHSTHAIWEWVDNEWVIIDKGATWL
jgi:hypothetical protein